MMDDDWDDRPLRPRGMDSSVADWLFIVTAAVMVFGMLALLILAGYEK